MKRSTGVALVVVALVGLAGIARGADKPDPTGTWKWTFNANRQNRDVTLTLKLDGDTLTGKISGRNNTEADIDDDASSASLMERSTLFWDGNRAVSGGTGHGACRMSIRR